MAAIMMEVVETVNAGVKRKTCTRPCRERVKAEPMKIYLLTSTAICTAANDIQPQADVIERLLRKHHTMRLCFPMALDY